MALDQAIVKLGKGGGLNIVHGDIGGHSEVVDQGIDDIDYHHRGNHGEGDFPEGHPPGRPFYIGGLIQRGGDGVQAQPER